MQPDIHKFLKRQITIRVDQVRRLDGGEGIRQLTDILGLFTDQRYYAFRSVDDVQQFWNELRAYGQGEEPAGDSPAIDLLMDIANGLYLYLGGTDDNWTDFLKGIARGICAGRTPLAKKADYQQADDDFIEHILKPNEWEHVVLANPWLGIAALLQLAQLSVMDIAEELRLQTFPRRGG